MLLAATRNRNRKPMNKTHGIYGISGIISQAQCGMADSLLDISTD
jgi:hypothetical protein